MNWGLLDRDGKSRLPSNSMGSPTMANVHLHLPPECRDEFSEMLREACDDGLRRRLCVTQTDRPLLVVDIIPLPARDGETHPALVLLNDSRENDSSYHQLRKLSRRNEAILRSAMDGFFVVDVDCRFLEVNDAFCGMVGYSAGELSKMRITDLEVDEHANGGVPSHTRTGLHHFPTAHRHRDGHLVHLEISVNVIHNAGEKILVGFARDVTQRRRAEEALRRLSREQKLILDSVAEGIAGIDRQGKITFVNPAAAHILGVAAVEIVGRSAHKVLFHVDRCVDVNRAAECPICTALNNQHGTTRAESEFLRSNSEGFPVEYSISLMCEGVDVVGAVLSFKDLTRQRLEEEERRNLESQIQQKQKLESLGLLAGGIAHDLNNTLVGVQGNACLALEQVSENSELEGRLRRIVGACERASKVIQQMLAYAGHVTCDAKPLDVNTLLVEMTEFMRAGVPKVVTFRTHLMEALPRIVADNAQLQQVVTNLLVNAIESIGDHAGEISISTGTMDLSEEESHRLFPGQDLQVGKYVCIYVADTGRGMSPDTLQRIFEPFFSRKGAGRGLGLAAMRGIIRAHRGGIMVESRLNEGARFTVVFPTLTTTVAERPSPKPLKRVLAGRTVLVVDDESEVRDVVRDMLTGRGLQVMTAKDGFDAIEVFRQHADKIDLVLLDMAMPGKNGDEVMRDLIAIRPDVRVIVSSGFIEENLSAQFGETEPAAFLYKPFTPDSLMERIGGVLEVTEA